MLIRSDFGHTGMMTFEVESVRRDNSAEMLQRGHAEGFSVVVRALGWQQVEIITATAR
jgi:hypothetical protein